jgi:hypothetical protein
MNTIPGSELDYRRLSGDIQSAKPVPIGKDPGNFWTPAEEPHSTCERIGMSIVGRSNLSLCMGLRRFTRLTNAFSKKVGQPLVRLLSALRLLQFLPHPSFASRDARDGIWTHRSRLGIGGIAGMKIRMEQMKDWISQLADSEKAHILASQAQVHRASIRSVMMPEFYGRLVAQLRKDAARCTKELSRERRIAFVDGSFARTNILLRKQDSFPTIDLDVELRDDIIIKFSYHYQSR